MSTIRSTRSSRNPKLPVNNAVKVHDLTIGWQNTVLARIDDNEGHTLLNLYTRDEIADVINALQLTLANMQRNADYYAQVRAEHPEWEAVISVRGISPK
jgi:hypothetical protein